MAFDKQNFIRNRNQPAAFYLSQKQQDFSTPANPVTADTSAAGVQPVGTNPPPGEMGIPAQTDTALESYNRQNNIDQPSPESEMPADSPTAVSTPAYNPEAPSAADAKNEAVRSSIVAPALAKIEENRKKADALRNMPVTDQDGRTKSGFAAFLMSLAQNPQLRNVRSWGDLARSMTYSGAVGVGGAIDKTWNERQKRDMHIAQLEQENLRLQKQTESDMKLANQESLIDSRARTQQRQDDAFEQRVNQDRYRRVQDEKKEVLAPIFKRGYFYQESASPEELKRLQDAGIILDDFDTTKTPYNDENGVRKVWNVRAREYQPAKGDEAEPMVSTEIDGVAIRLKPNEFANYKAQEKRTQYETSVRDADNEQEFNDKMQRWEEDERKRGDENIKMTNDANAKISKAYESEKSADAFEEEARAIADMNPGEAANLRSKAREKREDAGTLRTEANGLLNRAQNSKPAAKPVKQAKLPTYSSAVQSTKYTESEVRARIQKANPNATEAEIQQGIEKVKKAGAFKN